MATSVRLEGGPLDGKDAPVEDGQDELRIVLSVDADAGMGLDTPEHVYRRVDADTFAFTVTATVRDRVPTRPPAAMTATSDRVPAKPPTGMATPLVSLGLRLAARLRIAALGQLLLLSITPFAFTLSLEGSLRQMAVLALGLLLVLLGLPASAMFELRGRGPRVTRWGFGLGVLSLTMATIGGVIAALALRYL